jgi:hypothetical protein
MGVDLLRQQQHWKSTLMEIHHLMASLVHEGFNPANNYEVVETALGSPAL